ncbi:MAG: ABC transporter ATP-binding protein [Acidobacteriota bacterium]
MSERSSNEQSSDENEQSSDRQSSGETGHSGFLEIRQLCKSFGDTQVLKDLSLQLAEGEILALVGLSGSGKTTALRLLAGFEQPDSGEILVGGEDVAPLAPAQRGFGMVFQHYALFPHMTVFDNVAFGLEAQGRKTGMADRVQAMLELVDLAGFGGRKVSEISGGQQQRVALARALAPEPRVLLLDEPLSNLDPALRERTRRELKAAVRQVGITTVLVTHEQEEAFHVGDRVAVLNGGRLEQVGTAEELYRRAQSRFVATFVGRASVLRGFVDEVTPQKPGLRSREHEAWVALGQVEDIAVCWAGRSIEPVTEGERVEIVVKPESLRLATSQTGGALPGRVVELRFTGPLTYGVVRLMGGEEIEVLIDEEVPEAHQEVFVAPRPNGLAPRSGGLAPRIFRLEESGVEEGRPSEEGSA